MASDRWATIAGFAGAGLVLGVLVFVIGIRDVVAAFTAARVGVLPVVLLIAVVWLSCWGLALWVILTTLDAAVSKPKAILLFTAAVFANNVTPFGQAGGEPLSALLISEAADSEYETGLAAIASVDTLHFLPSIGMAIVGLTFIVTNATRLGRNLLFAGAVLVALSVALPIGGYLGWRYRAELEQGVVRVLTPILRTLGRIVPRRSPPAIETVEHRIGGFFTSIDRIGGDRRTLSIAMGLSAMGWLSLATALWTSLYAMGAVVSFTAALLIVPLAALSSVTPLPGGSGAFETVMVTLLVPVAGIEPSVALSGVLVYRGATYLFPVLVGGGVASRLGANRLRG